MKKLVNIALFLVFAILFSGCMGGYGAEKVTSLSFELVDGDSTASDYSQTNIVLAPDYELRNLAVDYGHVFPNRTEETVQLDVDTEGMLGGDFFDQFEEVMVVVMDKDFKAEEGEVVLMVIDMEGKETRYAFNWGDEIAGLDTIQQFYTNLVATFEENIY